MKILLIITKGEIGGAQVSVLNLAKTLSGTEDVVMVGFGEGEFLAKELTDHKVPYINFNWLKRTANPLANIFFIFELKSFLDKNKFDAVHFNSSNALFGAIGAKLSSSRPKTIFTFRGLSLLDANYSAPLIIKFFYRHLFKFLLLFIDKPVFVSATNQEAARVLKVAPRGEVVLNGLNPHDLKFLFRQDARQELGKLAGTDLKNNFVIGSIGRLAYPKNYEFLIEIFPEILKINNNACLVVIGEGKEKQKYLDLIKKSNLQNHIYFPGSKTDAYKYIKGFDLFVLPSIFEGLSITLIESLFSGVPILTTKVGGSPELLNYSEEQLYELNDKSEFLKKFKMLTSNDQLYNDISEKNKIRANIFHIKNTAGEYIRIYKTHSKI